MKTLLIPAALRSLRPAEDGPYSGVILSAEKQTMTATDGDSLVIVPTGCTLPRDAFIAAGDDPLHLDLALLENPGIHPPSEYELGIQSLLDAVAADPALFRIRLSLHRLIALAQAMDSDEVEVTFRSPQTPLVLSADSGAVGYFMPLSSTGLLIAAPTAEAPPAPPVTAEVKAREDIGFIEVHFTGKPEKELREALKAPSMGFRWSGDRGTKAGIPPRCWYGPLNPYTQSRLAELLPAA